MGDLPFPELSELKDCVTSLRQFGVVKKLKKVMVNNYLMKRNWREEEEYLLMVLFASLNLHSMFSVVLLHCQSRGRKRNSIGAT